MEYTHYVYLLQCPLDNKIRYVGCSVSPDQRLYQHILCSNITPKKNRKTKWINELSKAGLKPLVKVICSGSRKKMLKKEYELIKHYRKTIYNQTYILSNRQEILKTYGIDCTQFERYIYPHLTEGVDFKKINETNSFYFKRSFKKIEQIINKKIKNDCKNNI